MSRSVNWIDLDTTLQSFEIKKIQISGQQYFLLHFELFGAQSADCIDRQLGSWISKQHH